MDIVSVRDALTRFIRRHRTEFDRLSAKKSQLLEVASLAVCAEHYRLQGYSVSPANLKNGVFRVKLGSRGYPWNFSWFRCERPEVTVEVHSNLAVYSAYRKDEGVYVVDVGVVGEGATPSEPPDAGWIAVENDRLVTFAEAKYLVIYPMLLAQFVGIVTEIQPMFIGGSRPSTFKAEGHFDPSLMAIGYLHATAAKIARAYPQRGYLIKIVPALDMKLAVLRRGGILDESVLADDADVDLSF